MHSDVDGSYGRASFSVAGEDVAEESITST